VYPTVVGAADPSRPKADLGDGTQGWTFQVSLANVSDTAHTYSLGGQALSENVENGLFTRHATNWAGRGIDLTFSADSVTVPASSSATVTVTVTPREAFASYASATTPNGTFVDGAVTFTSADGQPDLTVPYMGFYGSWGAPNVFDQQWPNNHKVGYGSTVAHGVMPFGQSNPFQEEDARMADGIDPDRVVISRSTEERARRSIGTETVLLRAVPSLTFTLTNEAGQTLRSFTCDRSDKSVYDDHWRASHNVEFMSPGCAPRFDGYDADGNELPDGRYTVTIEASNYGPSAQTHQTSYSFWLDTAAPTVSNVSVAGEGDARTLSFDLSDSSPIAGYGFSLGEDGAVTMWHVEDNPSARADDGLFHQHYEVRLSEVTQALGENPSSLYLQAWDWPVNRGSAAVVVTPVAMTSLSVSPQAATMTVGETATVRATHQPDDANVTDVVWSSSNEAVATVDQDGVISAVGAGEATITVSDPTQPSVSASVTVRVSAAGPASQSGTWLWDVHGWWYRYEDGSYPSDTTLVLDGATYRFDAAGYMRTGWVSERGVWYYHHASGAQAKGWVLDGVHWYYMDPDTGAMVTGWLQVGGTWYYLSPANGAMVTGWFKDGDHWFYLHHGSGAMATGWVRIYLKWYQFNEAGQLIS
jgi:putative PA domain protein